MSDIETKGFLNRRHILQGAGALLAPAVLTLPIGAAEESGPRNTAVLYGQSTLPGGKQAGHSIPEEQPEQVNRLLLEFFRQASVLG